MLPTHIEKTYEKYTSLIEASKATGRDRGTIRIFLDTNVPIRGYLFFTRPILDFDKSFNQAKNYLSEINIDPSLSVKVWIYTIEEGKVILVNNQPFSSAVAAAKFLNTNAYYIRLHFKDLKPQGFKGYYIFNKPLDNEELNILFQLPKERVKRPRPGRTDHKISVWAYDF